MKYVLGLVGLVFVIWLVSMLKQSCGELEHTPMDRMDSATRIYYFQNC